MPNVICFSLLVGPNPAWIRGSCGDFCLEVLVDSCTNSWHVALCESKMWATVLLCIPNILARQLIQSNTCYDFWASQFYVAGPMPSRKPSVHVLRETSRLHVCRPVGACTTARRGKALQEGLFRTVRACLGGVLPE